MDLASDGTCPLCLAALPPPAGPRTLAAAIAALASHFGSECPATAFTTPRSVA